MAWGTFDIDDAVYDNKRFDAGDNGAWCCSFSSDGSKMYLGARSGGNSIIKQYSLSTPFDASTASADNKSISISGGNIPKTIFFKPDGTKIFIVAVPDYGYIYEYNLSTAWDLSTSSYVGRNAAISYYCYIRDNGELGFGFALVSSAWRVYKKTMSTAWTVSTLNGTDDYIQLGATAFDPAGLYFNDAGTKMYVISKQTNTVRQYTLSTAWNITTASYDSISFSLANQTSGAQGLTFNINNGSKFYVCDYRYVYQYTTYNPSFLKSVNGLSYSSVKSWNGLAKASIKSINGLS